MRLNLTNTPQRFWPIRRGGWIHIRVVTGTMLISSTQQTLAGGGGLSITSSDNIVSIVWEHTELWAQASTTAQVEIIIP